MISSRPLQSGAKSQAKALGIKLTILDSKNDAAIQGDLLEQAINRGYDGIVLDHGLTEVLKPLVARAVKQGIKVVAFDVNVEHPQVPQVGQSDFLIARFALEQAIKDNGTSFKAGYVYVPGFEPTDRRDKIWQQFKKRYPNIQEKARFGVVNDTTAASVADQAAAVFLANPDISVVFAPYDEYAKGVKLAVDEADLNKQVKIYSADISTSDIRLMVEANSAWVATAATNPAVVGRVSIRSVAMLIAGQNPGKNIIIPPTLVTQEDLRKNGIKNMKTLAKLFPAFNEVAVSNPSWIPIPKR